MPQVKVLALGLNENVMNMIDAECAYTDFALHASGKLAQYVGDAEQMRSMVSYLTQCVADGEVEQVSITRA